MVLDFGKLQQSVAQGALIEPRKIFTTLQRDPRFRRPSDEQADVLDQWFAKKTRRNNVIKMNTGAGKTLVGLLILQSSLNENAGPAVYITPDIYLTKQVLKEAAALGISVTDSESDPNFLSGNAILVANIYKLVNGRSVFGVGVAKIPIGSIIVDDAHACLLTVADQFSIEAGADSRVYKALVSLFEESLREQSEANYLEVKSQDPHAVMAVPYWTWKDKNAEITKILFENKDADEVKFAWPLLKDVLHLCNCYIGGGKIEISPRCLPIEAITSLDKASRRIFMTATLADDGILVTHFNCAASDVSDPIRPTGGGDIGDRMILAPQEVNPKISVEDVRSLAADLARTHNVVVIVPSGKRAQFWRSVAHQTLDKDSISHGVERLKAGHVGLTVLINKYDGIDLPKHACEVLIIDGLPHVFGLSERVEVALLEGTETHLVRQVQKLEQGMGRGVRSSEDHCVVLLLGPKLTQVVHSPAAREKFGSATLAQLNLGREVTMQVAGQTIDALKPVLDLCLKQDSNWVRTSRQAVATAAAGQKSFMQPFVPNMREAFNAARVHNIGKAIAVMQEAVNAANDNRTKAYLKLQLAEYIHHQNPVESQEILLSAAAENFAIVRPKQGISYRKLVSPGLDQGHISSAFLKANFPHGNDLIIWINALLDDLQWNPDATEEFEDAVFRLGRLLGFGSDRPEKKTRRGPDNLWAVGDREYYVIECKSGAVSDTIAKKDSDQLTGSINWFREIYDQTSKVTPFMFHPVNKFDRYSAPLPDARIVDSGMLSRLKDDVRSLAAAIAAVNYKDATEVAKQLTHFKFTKGAFLDRFTKSFSKQG